LIASGFFLQGGTVRLTNFLTASLPACNSSNIHQLAVVTDANSPTWNAVLSGGGSAEVLALCDGSNWRVH
jgi:hypothetical protein